MAVANMLIVSAVLSTLFIGYAAGQCQSTRYVSGLSSGYVQSDGFPNWYYHNSRCSWQVAAPPGYQIRFTVTMTWFQQCSGCNCDSVNIYDGPNTGYSTIFRTCTAWSTSTVTTSSNYGFVYFISDWGTQGPYAQSHGFSIYFETYIPVCQSTRYLTNQRTGYVQNDGYPGRYHDNSRCGWQLSVPAGSKIRFTINIGSMEANNDYVALHDGPSTGSTLLMKANSQQSATSVITTTTNNAFVYFFTDGSAQGSSSPQGFQFYYEEISSSSPRTVCRSTRTIGGQSNGYIRQDGYPDYYDDNSACGWQVTVRSGYKIRFHVSIGSMQTCCDFIAIYNGASTADTQLMLTSTQQAAPTVVTTTSNVGFVYFSTDSYGRGSGTPQGFQIYYEEVAPGSACRSTRMISGQSSGLIWQDGYPNYYDDNSDCGWKVTVPFGSKVRFDVNIGSMQEPNDYTAIYDGESPASANQLMRASSRANAISTLTSTSNVAFVSFFSDGGIQGNGHPQGFQLNFQEISKTRPVTVCRHTRTISGQTKGYLWQDGYPDYYDDDSACGWLVTVQPGHKVRLHILMGSMQANVDYVTVHDGASASSPQLIKASGPEITASVLTTTSNTAFVHFFSDSSIQGSGQPQGFQMEFEQVSAASPGVVCKTNRLVTGQSSGYIWQDGYPNYYDDNSACGWEITVNPGSKIRFQINIGSMGANDYVMIFNGPSSESPILLKANNSDTSASVLTTTSSSAFVYFYSDESGQGSSEPQGFKLYFEEISATKPGKVCRSLRTISGQSTGFIYNDGYPNYYDDNSACSWLVTVPVGSKIRFHVGIGSMQTCCDYVTIHDGSSTGAPQLMKASSYEKAPTAITTTSNTAYVYFFSDFAVQGYGEPMGFRLYFEEVNKGAGGKVCQSSRLISGQQSGFIRNDGYPNYYDDNSECGWQVTVSPGKVIRFYLIVDSMEGCCDRVSIYDSSIANNRIATTTQTGFSGVYYTSSNVGYVHFSSDDSVSMTGFEIYYEESEPVTTTTISTTTTWNTKTWTKPKTSTESTTFELEEETELPVLTDGPAETTVEKLTEAVTTTSTPTTEKTFQTPTETWPRDSSVIGIWPLDGENGIRDVAGNQLDGEVFDQVPTTVDGPFGDADTAQQPASNTDAIFKASSDLLKVKSSFTVAFFFKTPTEATTATLSGGIFELGSSDSSFQIGYKAASSAFEIRADGAIVGSYVMIGRQNVWSFFAVTYNGDDETLTVFSRYGQAYVPVAYSGIRTALLANADGHMRVGYTSQFGYMKATASISCLSVYSAALTGVELQRLQIACRVLQGSPPCGAPRIALAPIPRVSNPPVPTLAQAGQFPWIASLRQGTMHICSASILSPYYLLTAAVCFLETKNPASYSIVVGENDVKVSEEAYYEKPHALAKIEISKDVALIELKVPIAMTNNYVNDACLFQPGFNFSSVSLSTPSVDKFFFGWGKNGRSNQVSQSLGRYTVGDILSENDCQQALGASFNPTKNYCFLAKGADKGVPCAGDEGSPVMLAADESTSVRGVGEHLVQFGLFKERSSNCAADKPGNFVKLLPHEKWIRDKLSCVVPGYHYPSTCPQ